MTAPPLTPPHVPTGPPAPPRWPVQWGILLLGAIPLLIGVYAVSWSVRYQQEYVDEWIVPIALCVVGAIIVPFGFRAPRLRRLIALALAALLVLLGVSIYAMNAQRLERHAALRALQAEVDVFRALCADGTPVPAAASLANGAPPYRAILLRRQIHSGDWYVEWNHGDLLAPRPPAEIPLVVCLETEALLYEFCTYRGSGGASDITTVDRVQYSSSARLIEARTGRVLDRATALGSEPPACGGTHSTAVSPTLGGSYPTSLELFEAFRPWIGGASAP
jgi:hypothetical protein